MWRRPPTERRIMNLSAKPFWACECMMHEPPDSLGTTFCMYVATGSRDPFGLTLPFKANGCYAVKTQGCAEWSLEPEGSDRQSNGGTSQCRS